MRITGRMREREILEDTLGSHRPELVAVCGRCGIGKTYLIREFFLGRFTFCHTGLRDAAEPGQIEAFQASLRAYGDDHPDRPENWYESFRRLRELLCRESVYRDMPTNRRVVFLDEVPWMDTPESDFLSAIDHFWNSWGSSQEDLVLIVCGSSTHWMLRHLVHDSKGFCQRLTRRMHLMPFSLRECEELLYQNGVTRPRQEIIETWMIFGGVPRYLSLLSPRLTLSQNIDELCFRPYGELRNEYQDLLRALFRNPSMHLKILDFLGESNQDRSLKEISERTETGDSESLTQTLEELEACGLISACRPNKATKGTRYRLSDPFGLFSLRFLNPPEHQSWSEVLLTPACDAWRESAFELLCMSHIPQIKRKLGISGTETQEYVWSLSGKEHDHLLIERRDGILHLCEMKCTDVPFEMDGEGYDGLIQKLSALQRQTHGRKAVHLTLVSASGLKWNQYAGTFLHVIEGEDLFSELPSIQNGLM
ncbi:MAG: hypothetical protein IJ083_12515 [Clostridia bacterium]|nr:hypothetical protein [Clostridia bacterium]